MVDPVTGYARTAPTQLRFVIGPPADTNSYLFSGHYDFLTNTITVTPYLSQLKATFTSPMDLSDGLYAQIFFWTADNRNCYIQFDQVTLTVRGDIAKPAALGVNIDVKPGDNTNSLNPRAKGMIPVAILSTTDFDATTVEPTSVEFGPNGATEAHGRGHIEDVNGDGLTDIVLHFKIQETGLRCGDMEVFLTGKTLNWQAIEGRSDIRTVGCNR